MRKILGISASTRLWGNCETSVKQVLAAAMEAGARTVGTPAPSTQGQGGIAGVRGGQSGGQARGLTDRWGACRRDAGAIARMR